MGYAPSIRRAAAELGITPAEYLARQQQERGAGVSSGGSSYTPPTPAGVTTGTSGYSTDNPNIGRGLDAVAATWDPISGDWYYVRAESINGQAALQDPFATANRPGTPVPTQLDAGGVAYVPVLGANGPQADGTWLNQQQVREQQQVLSGTTMETNFPRPGSTPGIVEPPEREAPPAPAAPRPQYATPSTGTPKLDASPNTGGQRATGLVAGQRGGLDVFLSPDSPGASVAGLTIKPRR